MSTKPSGDFVPGMQVNEFTLIKWLQTDEKGEQWLVKSPLHPLGISVYLNRSVEIKHGYAALPESGLSEGMMFGPWQLSHMIARATTAELWQVKKAQDPQKYVIKIGTSDQPERIEQVTNEIHLLKRLKKFSGSVSMLDCHLKTKDSYPWFVMPWTDNIKQFLGAKADTLAVNNAVQSFIALIEELVKQNIYYPDIQLEHLRYEQQRAVLIDFGAAIYPANKFIIDGQLLKPNSQVIATQLHGVLVALYEHYQLKKPAFLMQANNMDLNELNKQLLSS